MITADQVAYVIEAACQTLDRPDVKALALRIAGGENDSEEDCADQTWPVMRTRAYAAMVLHRYLGVPKTSAARLVGVVNPSTQKVFISNVRGRSWMEDSKLEQIERRLLARGIAPASETEFCGKNSAKAPAIEPPGETVPVAPRAPAVMIGRIVTADDVRNGARAVRDTEISLAQLARERRERPLGKNVTRDVIDAKADGIGLSPLSGRDNFHD